MRGEGREKRGEEREEGVRASPIEVEQLSCHIQKGLQSGELST